MRKLANNVRWACFGGFASKAFVFEHCIGILAVWFSHIGIMGASSTPSDSMGRSFLYYPLLGILNIITKSRLSSKSSNGAKNAKPIPHTT